MWSNLDEENTSRAAEFSAYALTASKVFVTDSCAPVKSRRKVCTFRNYGVGSLNNLCLSMV